MKYIKEVLLFVTVIVLFAGVVSASDAIDNAQDTAEVTQQAVQTTTSVSYDTGTTGINTEETVKDMRENTTFKEKNLIKNEKNSNVKTSSHTYNVDNYDALYDAIYSADYDDVTINIESDISLSGSKDGFEDDTNKTLTINGNGFTINGQGSYQFLWIGSKWNITINNLTFTNCYSKIHGGVIDNYGANITLNNCKLTNNSAPYGGAINNQRNCLIILNNCELSGNRQTQDSPYAYGGGAIFNEDSTIIINNSKITDNNGSKGGALYNAGTMIITYSTISNNLASGIAWGGAICSNGTVSITDSIISNNKADSGGAIYTFRSNFNINNVTFNNNTAWEEDGGAIYNRYYGTMTINNSEFNDNIVTGHGGAIFGNFTLNIANTNFNNNNCTQSGGAIYQSRNNLTVENCTFSNNNAKGTEDNMGGGAIENDRVTANIYNCEFYNNNGNNGGAILSNGTLNINNTILNNNKASRGGAIGASGSDLNLFNSTLKNNTATEKLAFVGGAGGAVFSQTTNTKILNNQFIANNANTNGNVILAPYAILNNNLYADTSKYGNTILCLGDNIEVSNCIFYEDPFRTKMIITSNNTKPAVNEKINVTVKLSDQFDFAVVGQEISISINGQTSKRRTDQNGTVSIEYIPRNDNTIKINVAYEDKSNYYGSTSATLDIDVKKSTRLYVEDVSSVVGQECTINGTLTDADNNPLIEENVCITVYNHTYLVTTDEYGQFDTTLTFPESGKNDIEILFNGNYDYGPSNLTRTLTVISQASIDMDILNYTDSNLEIEITVTDETGAVIPEQDVVITLTNGTDTTRKTDSDGKIRITDTGATVGEKAVTATVESTEKLNGTTETRNIMVVPDYQKIIENLMNIIKEENETITQQNKTINEQNNTINEQNKTINDLNETVNNQNKIIDEQSNTINEQNRTIEDLNNRNKILNDTVQNLTQQLKDANDKINEQNKTIKDLNNQLDTANKEIAALTDMNKNLTAQLENANNEIELLKNAVNYLSEQLDDANEIINSLNDTNKELTSQLENANSEIELLKNAVNYLSEQLDDANDIINSLNDTNKELMSQVENAENEIELLKNAVNYLSEQLDDANDIINSLNDTNKKLTAQLQDANKQIKTLNDTINSLTKQLNDAKEKIENLNKIIDELLNKKPLNTTITINPIKSSIGEIATLTANIIAQNGDKVTGGKAVFKVNGITLKDDNNNVLYATVTDGTASISYKVQDVWMKSTSTVQAVYGGTEKYAQSRTNASDVLDISNGKATIALEKDTVTAKAGQTITLKATVLDANGDRISTGKVVFKLNGKTLKDDNGETLYAYVKDGEATLDYTIPGIYSAKAYKLTAVFGGGNYERAETSGTLMLERKAVTINVDKITTKNNKTTIKATITDETGKLLAASTKLAIKINGKTVLNNVTSSNGKIDVSFTLPLRPGMYELTIISGENGLYKKGTLTTVLKV